MPLVGRGDGALVAFVSREQGRVYRLAAETRNAIVGFTTAEAHAGAPELLEVAAPLLEESRAREEEEALERWREEAGKNGRAASAWKTTLEAASDGRVDVLLFHEGVDREAWECPQDGRASADAGACPLDGTPMERRESGLDLAVHQTLAHGGTVTTIHHHRDLEPVEGIAALLRY